MAGEPARIRSVDEMVRDLPPELKQEVEDFIHFLILRRRKTPGRALRLSWKGALKALAAQYSSVELQHEITRSWAK
jgi:hypothetical protein